MESGAVHPRPVKHGSRQVLPAEVGAAALCCMQLDALQLRPDQHCVEEGRALVDEGPAEVSILKRTSEEEATISVFQKG